MKPKFTEKELDLIYKAVEFYYSRAGNTDEKAAAVILEKLEK